MRRNLRTIVRHLGYFVPVRTVSGYNVISTANKSIFTGYFDVNCLNNRKLYYHAAKHEEQLLENPNKFDIEFIDLESGESRHVTSTRACNYQLGARLHFPEPDRLFFNDIQNGMICLRELIFQGDDILEITPLKGGYFSAIDSNTIIQISYENLFRFRPSYGYNGKDGGHKTIQIMKRSSPNENWEVSWIYKISQNYDYVNNILVDKNSGNFCWLEVCEGKRNRERNNKLMIYENEIVSDLDTGHISHCYFFCNNLFYTKLEGQSYNLYKYSSNDRRITLEKVWGRHDAHFAVHGNRLFYDTYPNVLGISSLKSQNLCELGQQKVISKFWNHPIFTGGIRCDHHPKVSENYLIFDFTRLKKRCVGVYHLDNNDYD
jgi:hypothetical protein